MGDPDRDAGGQILWWGECLNRETLNAWQVTTISSDLCTKTTWVSLVVRMSVVMMRGGMAMGGCGWSWVVMEVHIYPYLFGPCGLSMQASHDLHSEDWSFTSWDRTAGWPTRGEGWCRKKGTTFSENVTRRNRETDSMMMYKSWFGIPVFFGALFESFGEAIQQVDLVLWKSAEHWNARNGTPAPNAAMPSCLKSFW